jgi:tetratricopeptide (TPR) repeat protein
MKTIIILLIILFFFDISQIKSQSIAEPEKILRFADYLYNEKDYFRSASEYERYLFFSPNSPNADSIRLKIGICHQLRGSWNFAIKNFEMLAEKNKNFKNETGLNIGYTYFLAGRPDEAINYLKNRELDLRKFYIIGWSYISKKQWKSARESFNEIIKNGESAPYFNQSQKLFNLMLEGEKLPQKSPLLAGFLSTIIPGLGKIYCKRYGDGFFSMAVVSVTGYLTYRNYQKENTITTIFIGSFAGALYLGNIYGSYIAGKVVNEEIQENFFHKIESSFPKFVISYSF